MILASILTLAAFAVLIRLLFGLAVFALPVACGAGAGFVAHASGAGWLGSAIIALIAGTIALAIGQTLFALARSPIARVAVGSLYALPAAALGFGMAYGLLGIGVDSPFWRIALSLVGAGVTGWVAFQNVGALAPPAEAGRAADGSAHNTLDPVTSSASWPAHPRRRVRDGRAVMGAPHRP